ncbi:MAG: DctP family TRAP transporter solute-binding subunit [Dehalobacterium sp.]
MKKFLLVSFILFLVAGVLLTGCSEEREQASEGIDEQIVIRFSHVSPEASTKGRAVNLFRDLVEERLGDKVKVEVYPAGQLFSDTEGLEALQAGNIQMMFLSNSKLIGMDPSFQIANLPFFWKDGATALNFLNGPEGQKMKETTEPFGIKVLATWFSGNMQFTNSVRPLKQPSDFNGIQFRIMSGGLLEDQFVNLGAGAQVLPFGELYIALQRGTVDGQENPMDLIVENKYYEVQKYLTISNHAPATHSILTNKDHWDNLPDDIRSEIESILQEVTEQEIQWADEDEEKYLEILKEKGIEIHELSNAEYETFRKACEPLYAKYKDIIGQELMDKAEAYNK